MEEKGNMDRYLNCALRLIIDYYLNREMSAKQYTDWYMQTYKYVPDYLLFLNEEDWVVGEYAKANGYEKQLMANKRDQLRKELADEMNQSTNSDDWSISFIHPEYVVKFGTWFPTIKVTNESLFRTWIDYDDHKMWVQEAEVRTIPFEKNLRLTNPYLFIRKKIKFASNNVSPMSTPTTKTTTQGLTEDTPQVQLRTVNGKSGKPKAQVRFNRQSFYEMKITNPNTYANPPPTPKQIFHNIEKDKHIYENTSEIRERIQLWGRKFQNPPSKKISFTNDTSVYVDMDQLKSETLEQRVQKKVNGKTATVVRMENDKIPEPLGSVSYPRLVYLDHDESL